MRKAVKSSGEEERVGINTGSQRTRFLKRRNCRSRFSPNPNKAVGFLFEYILWGVCDAQKSWGFGDGEKQFQR